MTLEKRAKPIDWQAEAESLAREIETGTAFYRRGKMVTPAEIRAKRISRLSEEALSIGSLIISAKYMKQADNNPVSALFLAVDEYDTPQYKKKLESGKPSDADEVQTLIYISVALWTKALGSQRKDEIIKEWQTRFPQFERTYSRLSAKTDF